MQLFKSLWEVLSISTLPNFICFRLMSIQIMTFLLVCKSIKTHPLYSFLYNFTNIEINFIVHIYPTAFNLKQNKYYMISLLSFIVFEIPSTICFITLHTSLICIWLEFSLYKGTSKTYQISPMWRPFHVEQILQ